MKKIHFYIASLALALLVGCSSMEVDESKEYSENFPEDFVDSVYMELHPALRARQIKDYVKSHNESLKSKLGDEKYKELLSSDTTAFFSDTAKLHKIFVYPYCLGFSEDDWDEVWESIETSEVECKFIKEFKQVFLIINSDTTKIFVDSLQLDDNGSFKVIYGKKDSAGASQAYAIGDTIVYFNKGAVYDSTEVCDTSKVVVDGSLSSIHKSLLSEFNLYDEKDDLTALKEIPVDMYAIAYQYLVYGKQNGWTYRYCKDSEISNPVRPILESGAETNKLYCDDHGIAREIQ